MKHFTLLFALSIIICPCLAANSAFAQDAPKAQQAAKAKSTSQPKVSVIEINADPRAAVYIDDEQAGTTPVSIAVEPGKHDFRIFNPNPEYNFDFQKTIKVKAGQKVSYFYSFKEEYDESKLSEESLPELKAQLAESQLAKKEREKIEQAKRKAANSQNNPPKDGNAARSNRAESVNVELPF